MTQRKIVTGVMFLCVSLAACGGSDSVDVDGEYSLRVVDGYEQIEAIGFCPAEGEGVLAEMLMGNCADPAEWEDEGSLVFGHCTDPLYPVLPSPPENPNPEAYRFRATVGTACSHPLLAEAIGCGSEDEAEAALAIEFRDGLYPLLPGGMYFCPLVAYPL